MVRLFILPLLVKILRGIVIAIFQQVFNLFQNLIWIIDPKICLHTISTVIESLDFFFDRLHVRSIGMINNNSACCHNSYSHSGNSGFCSNGSSGNFTHYTRTLYSFRCHGCGLSSRFSSILHVFCRFPCFFFYACLFIPIGKRMKSCGCSCGTAHRFCCINGVLERHSNQYGYRNGSKLDSVLPEIVLPGHQLLSALVQSGLDGVFGNP